MSNRSKVQQIAAAPGQVEVEGIDPDTGEEKNATFKIAPLSNQDLLNIQSSAEEDRLVDLLYLSLKPYDENLKKEHLQDFDFKFANKIIQEIGEVNGIEDFFDEEEIREAIENQT